MSNALTIWTNGNFSEDQWAYLKVETENVDWRPSAVAGPSVLAAGQRDPSLLGASIAWGQPDPADLLENDALRWVQISTAGYTRYDTPDFQNAMRERGVLVTNSSGVYDRPCAEHVLAFLFSEIRGIPEALGATPQVGSADWHQLRAHCRLLHQLTILILGYGAIGEEIARLLKPFGCRVVGLRRRPRGEELAEVFPMEEMERVLPEADIIINILPDHPDTRNVMNADFFDQGKPGCVVMNIGRGNTLDQEALRLALDEKKVARAWLDVTDPEPLPADHPLQAHPRCQITPHIAGGHHGEADTGIRHFLENLKRFRADQPLSNRIL